VIFRHKILSVLFVQHYTQLNDRRSRWSSSSSSGYHYL